MNLVPLKVKIGLRQSFDPKTGLKRKEADHPDFNVLPSVQAAQMDWAHYIDQYGSGWLYDGCCGHKEATPDSPMGEQWGMILVPKAFAEEAIATYPLIISKMTEAECKTFYETHHSKEMSSEEIDLERLNAIKAKEDAGIALSTEDLDARDPATDTRGIRKNMKKTWDDYKIKTATKIVQ